MYHSLVKKPTLSQREGGRNMPAPAKNSLCTLTKILLPSLVDPEFAS